MKTITQLMITGVFLFLTSCEDKSHEKSATQLKKESEERKEKMRNSNEEWKDFLGIKE